MTAPVPERWVDIAAQAAYRARSSEPDQETTSWDELPESWKREWCDSAEAALAPVLADLRARVDALPRLRNRLLHLDDCPGGPGKRGLCTCGRVALTEMVPLRDVLSLIDCVDLCRYCAGTPDSCTRARIKCCPDCTHGSAT